MLSIACVNCCAPPRAGSFRDRRDWSCFPAWGGQAVALMRWSIASPRRVSSPGAWLRVPEGLSKVSALVLSVPLAELINVNELRVLLFLLIRREVRKGLGAAGWCESGAHGQVTWICWDPAVAGQTGLGCPSGAGRADPPLSRELGAPGGKPFAPELPEAESKAALRVRVRCARALSEPADGGREPREAAASRPGASPRWGSGDLPWELLQQMCPGKPSPS